MDQLSTKLTQAAFGALVGISQAAVSQLMSRGVLTPDAAGSAWLVEYCSHLREQAAGRAAEGGLDLASERARVAKEQADKLAMQNAVTRKEMAPTYILEDLLAKAGGRVGSILDTIPGMIKRRMPSLNAVDVAAIKAEVDKARNMIAHLSLSDVEQTEDDAGRDGDLLDQADLD